LYIDEVVSIPKTHTHNCEVLITNHDKRVQLNILAFSVEGVII